MNQQQPWLVDTPDQLIELCTRLQGSPWLAVDTEFLREKTYYPKLCLLQVATADVAACVDPLALDDLSPLLDILYDRSVVKIFHSASQDLEIFYHLRNQVPGPLFDSQVAAPLLGHPDQMGYAAMVQSFLNITLDKSHTRTDWSRRPLNEKQLRYAVDDVIHLATIYPMLIEKLTANGRLQWLEDDLKQLENPEKYSIPLENAWTKVKAARRMKGKKLNVLKGLAAWREQRARDTDRPKGWILKDDVMLDLCTQQPGTPDDLEHIRSLPPRLKETQSSKLLEIITTALEQPVTNSEPKQDFTRLTPAQDAITDILMAVLRLRCADENINPTTIAGRKDLEAMVSGERQVNVLKGWRRALAGETLLGVLEGNVKLRVENGQPLIES